MKRCSRLGTARTTRATLALMVVTILAGGGSGLSAKRKGEVSGPNAATSRLFQVLDSGYNGKLDDFYLLADAYKDTKDPSIEYRRVLRLAYDKAKVFGKLTVVVRSVGKLDPQQLQTYTAKQIFDFGETDSEKFVKTSDGDFGATGDLYLKASDDAVLASSQINDDVRKEYDTLISQFVLPALEKTGANARPGLQ